ncbi:hypothetical protein BVRB_7g165350 [Beta vulgaris subsp. vulgaris]|nr:hypothetical protein BVRB_7g165350 [Beta vulgaris subsp. vulgaris]
MRQSMKPFAVILLMLLLAFATEDGPRVAEALFGRCKKVPSRTYKGPCARDANCRSVCISEGYNGGDCHGFRRRCMCTDKCS